MRAMSAPAVCPPARSAIRRATDARWGRKAAVGAIRVEVPEPSPVLPRGCAHRRCAGHRRAGTGIPNGRRVDARCPRGVALVSLPVSWAFLRYGLPVRQLVRGTTGPRFESALPDLLPNVAATRRNTAVGAVRAPASANDPEGAGGPRDRPPGILLG